MLNRLSILTFIIISLAVYGLPTQLLGQNGLIFDDIGYQKTELADKSLSRSRSGGLRKGSLKSYCPVPPDQGKGIPSCVGHALANALSLIHAIKNTRQDAPARERHKFSASYIYHQIKVGAGCGRGATLDAGLKLLVSLGDVKEQDFPNNTKCALPPPTALKEIASQYKIKVFKALFEEKPKVSKEDLLSRIKNYIDDKISPIIVALTVPQDFRSKPPQKDSDWDSPPQDGHALIIVGYNDEKGAFELMNSYGSRWANSGFINISYEVFYHHVKYAYILELNP